MIVSIMSILIINSCIGIEEDIGDISNSDKNITRAKDIIEKVVFSDSKLRTYAISIIRDCPSNCNACYVNAIYNFITKNFKYYKDPQKEQIIQTPWETIKNKGGDCEDLTILLMSLLENIGIKTYLGMTEGHIFCFAEGVNIDEAYEYVIKVKQDDFCEKWNSSNKGTYAFIENKNLFIVRRNTVGNWELLRSGYYHYFGYNGEPIEYPYETLEIRYWIVASKPIDLYILPTKNELEALRYGKKFTTYPICNRQKIYEINSSCRIGVKGLIVIRNPHDKDIYYKWDVLFCFKYSKLPFLRDINIRTWTIGGNKCIILESTGGSNSYIGWSNITTCYIIDPYTGNYTEKD